jgi:predicted RNA methylase
VAQETGFSRFLPTGEGLLAFETLAEAAERVEDVEGDPARHGAAAREIAVEHLDSDRVLDLLLARLGANA